MPLRQYSSPSLGAIVKNNQSLGVVVKNTIFTGGEMKLQQDMSIQKPVYPGPLYLQINRLLLQRVESGVWPVGTALPNESDLAREYGVSVGTMRKALEKLGSDGWIFRRQGRGTFVTDPRQVSRKRSDHFFLNGEHYVLDGFEYLSSSCVPVTSEAAKSLGLEMTDTIVCITRSRIAPGIIQVHDTISVPREFLPDLAADAESCRDVTDDDLAGYNTFIRRCFEKVMPAVADGNAAKKLKVAPGTGILECERTSYGANNRPVEWCQRLVRLERVEYWTETA